MKKLLIIFLLGIITSCSKDKQYIVEITYINGDKDTISLIINNYQDIYLYDGCLGYNSRTISCYVRDFNIITINEIRKE